MKAFIIICIIYYIINIIICEDNYFIRINNVDYSFELKNNEVANQLKAKLPFTIKMTNLNNNEVYHKFDDDFKKNEKSVGTINIGDIHLYKSDTLVLFYKSFQTSYSYTEIGKLKNTTNLENNIGSKDVIVQWCLNNCTDSISFISFIKINYLLLILIFILL